MDQPDARALVRAHAVPQPTPVQARNHVSGPWVAALFVIALVASALGSG